MMYPKILQSMRICTFILLCLLSGFVSSCKKDIITVNETKDYYQVGHIPTNAYDGGWNLTLKPGGIADVNPGGDIRYRGRYKIIGSKIIVKMQDSAEQYRFDILSEWEIREKTSGVVLALK